MIDHLKADALAVQNVQKCAEFYGDRLGFELKVLEDRFAYLTFGPKGSPGLALVSTDGFTEELAEKGQAPTASGLSRGYFAVFLGDADAEYAALRAKGVHFLTPPTTRPSGQRSAFFEDPEGNVWEISHFPRG